MARRGAAPCVFMFSHSGSGCIGFVSLAIPVTHAAGTPFTQHPDWAHLTPLLRVWAQPQLSLSFEPSV